MAKIDNFEKYHKEYEEWFENHQELYEEEIRSVKRLVKSAKNGLEIGVGTGRFALPLHIKTGVEPSLQMAKIAAKRGIEVHKGTAENLPFEDEKFDFAIMVTTVCFVDDMEKSFKEAFRVIKKGGFFIVGYVDRDSELGKKYRQKQKTSKFYSNATFYSTDEIENALKKIGFSSFKYESVEKTKNSFIFLKSLKV